MATVLAILGMLAALIPVLVEAYRVARDKHTHANKAIRQRDRDELRAGMQRVDRSTGVHPDPEPLPPRPPARL